MRANEHNTPADPDLRTYRWAGFTLTAGMYASFAAMGAGLLWWLASGAPGGGEAASKVVPLDRIVPEMAAMNPLALLNLGVLLLLVTPGLTLLTEIVSYALARNWRFVGVAALVGIILLLSLVLSVR